MTDRQRAASGSPFEDQVGFCRALRAGNRVLVSGTAPIWPDGHVDPDPRVQAGRCFEIIAEALHALGAGFADVIRTRMYVTDRADVPAISAVHGEAFRGHPPAATMVIVAGLLDPRWRVEIEAEAEVAADRA